MASEVSLCSHRLQENKMGKVTTSPRVTREGESEGEGERAEVKDREPSDELLQGGEELTKGIQDPRPGMPTYYVHGPQNEIRPLSYCSSMKFTPNQ